MSKSAPKTTSLNTITNRVSEKGAKQDLLSPRLEKSKKSAYGRTVLSSVMEIAKKGGELYLWSGMGGVGWGGGKKMRGDKEE